MKTLTDTTRTIRTLDLPKGELIGLRQRHGATAVEVRAGRVWATRDCEPKDFVLGPGQAAVFRGRGLILIEALEESTVSSERY
jgi:ferric-dicitrate binding protein FerR (iron transport regulator)